MLSIKMLKYLIILGHVLSFVVNQIPENPILDDCSQSYPYAENISSYFEWKKPDDKIDNNTKCFFYCILIGSGLIETGVGKFDPRVDEMFFANQSPWEVEQMIEDCNNKDEDLEDRCAGAFKFSMCVISKVQNINGPPRVDTGTPTEIPIEEDTEISIEVVVTTEEPIPLGTEDPNQVFTVEPYITLPYIPSNESYVKLSPFRSNTNISINN